MMPELFFRPEYRYILSKTDRIDLHTSLYNPVWISIFKDFSKWDENYQKTRKDQLDLKVDFLMIDTMEPLFEKQFISIS